MIDNPMAESGRGLLVVRSLAVRTGQCGNDRGRLIWADIPWNMAAAEPVPPDSPEAAIGDGMTSLASRFSGVPAWFGRSTLQWWALAAGELVSASSASELSRVLDRLLGLPAAPGPQASGSTPAQCRQAGASDLCGELAEPDSRGMAEP